MSEEFRERRAKMIEALGEDTLVLFSGPVSLRNNDVDYDYRQSSDFFYLTGFEEPEAVLVLRKKSPQSVLFLRDRDPERETWDGRRLGVAAAPAKLGVEVAFPIGSLAEKLPDLLEDVTRVHSSFDEEVLVDSRLRAAVVAVRARRRKRVTAPSEFVDAGVLIHEARLRKSPQEAELMRKAAQISRAGHEAAMRAVRPGMNEFELQNVVEFAFRSGGSKRLAYSSIVGGGVNATILHYRENESPLREGDLVLIDAGAEYGYYASDITRTFPVSGKFSPLQRKVYELVLASQLRAIELTVVGRTIDEIHDAAVEVLVAGCLELGLISKTAAEPKKELTRFYMHRTSHFLGMDVHDVGRYYEAGAPRPLEPGMVITIEPGLYFGESDESVPEELRGVGIRIEDDVLVTPSGPDVLSAGTPKTVDELESIIGR